jgi:hypothetical protein
VAQALTGGHTVVTHEMPFASVRKIKIPYACIGPGIKFVSPFEMLRRERARFKEKDAWKFPPFLFILRSP